MTSTQQQLVERLHKMGGRISTEELAHKTGLSIAQLWEELADLESQGHVTSRTQWMAVRS